MNKPLPGDQVWGGEKVGGDGLLDDGLGHLANLLGHVTLNSRWGKNIFTKNGDIINLLLI